MAYSNPKSLQILSRLPISDPARPDPARPDPARPDPAHPDPAHWVGLPGEGLRS